MSRADPVVKIKRPASASGMAVFDAVLSLTHRLRLAQNLALHQLGLDLTQLEARALDYFAGHPDATLTDLVSDDARDKGQIARLLASLRNKGLVTVTADAHDRRVVHYRLSALGRTRHRRLQRHMKALATRAFASVTAQDLGKLHALLLQLERDLI